MLLDELRTLITRHAHDGGTAALDGVLVSLVTEPAPPATSTTGTVLALIAQGAKSLALGDRIYEYRAGQYLVASVDLPVTGQFTEASPAEPALGFGLVLRPSVIAELLLDPAAGDFRRVGRGVAAPSGIAVSDASDELIDAAVRMLRLLDRPRDLPVLAPMVEREILWLLMTGEQDATVRQLGLADSSLSCVGHAVRWIRDHYADTIRVDDLAQTARMSPSAFHRSFRAVTAMSPIQFQKQIRLQEARLLLIADPGDVAGTAYAVGYESPSQFSREYRRQFGTPPGKDAARLRETALATG
ncbi:AraC family transcriptional regulator [Streptomyces sp. NBC_01217]|uniref:AraC family transcriptional regulator n=1 Tax=Streptomyces sp. NBC_01217 TaxID=2903779 RepID=UPI002E0F7F3D|nr:AraC family transcriptional regulator [Streptomyces sp. NBC_01217]